MPMYRRLIPLLAIVVALAVLASSASAAPLSPSTQDRLAHSLRGAFNKTRAPAVIAGVWIGNRGWTGTVWRTTFGKGTKPSYADHTRIGSVTKTFTGTVILQLVEEGKLRL